MTRDIRQEMGDYLPRYYGDSNIVGNILDRESEEFTQLNEDIQDVLNQFFVDTATWGLSNWERICGIATDETKTYDERRSVIRSKLRGIGTVTVAMIKSVAESYGNGEVEVTESPSTYNIDITFVSTLGVPTKIADIQQSLREIIPAHLGITYTFNYMLWNDLNGYGFTWTSQNAQNFTWNTYETYKP